MTEEATPIVNETRDTAIPPKPKEPQNIVLLGTQQPKRMHRRRRSWFGWLGFPSRADAAQHLRMIGRHFLSLIGWRA